MLKALLLQHLHDATDPKLEERVNNDLSWRRFACLGLADGTLDHTTISRFRGLMLERGLMRRVFDAVNDQLDEKGTVIDATVVQAQGRLPRYPTDGEGGRIGSPIYPEPDWGRRSNLGFKGQLPIDHGSWLVRDARLTPAQVGDIGMFEALIRGDEGWCAPTRRTRA